jgi:23S rRNA pseudouridine1911/1915/1917 synthase
MPRLPFTIVYEDRDILVIAKPPGLLTSTVPREKRPTALKSVLEYLSRTDPRARAGLIHRLDRDASGLLVFSKNHHAYVSLKQQFFKHSVERIYLAVVHGVPTPRQGTITSRLVERADGTVYSTRNHGKGERAVTHYQMVSQAKRQSLLRVKLETGKKHQIRVHLSERGVPIVNDPVYCDQKPQGRLMLIAAELTIEHPRTGKRMTFRMELPDAFIATGASAGDSSKALSSPDTPGEGA